MDIGIPLLKNKNLLESNPLKLQTLSSWIDGKETNTSVPYCLALTVHYPSGPHLYPTTLPQAVRTNILAHMHTHAHTQYTHIHVHIWDDSGHMFANNT